jgi:hypothetical protein
MDTRAINHVLHSSDYHKPSYLRYGVAQLLGEGKIVRRLASGTLSYRQLIGLVFAEGSQHRQQVGICLHRYAL